MEERPFQRQALDPRRMRWALVISMILVVVSALLTWSVVKNIPDTFVFLLSQEGWPEDADRNPVSPWYWRGALVTGSLAVLVPLIALIGGVFARLIRDFYNKLALKQHTVVCGLGWQGKALVEHLRQQPCAGFLNSILPGVGFRRKVVVLELDADQAIELSLIHISEPTRPY